jgi:hypothetical protein
MEVAGRPRQVARSEGVYLRLLAVATPSMRRAIVCSFLWALCFRLDEATSSAHGAPAPALAAARAPGIGQLGACVCSGALAALLILVSGGRQLHGVATAAWESTGCLVLPVVPPSFLPLACASPCVVGAAVPSRVRVGMAVREGCVR